MNATVRGSGKIDCIRIRHKGLNWNFQHRYPKAIWDSDTFGAELILDIADVEELEMLDKAIMECKEAIKFDIGRFAFIGTT